MFATAMSGAEAGAIAEASQQFGLEARSVGKGDWQALRLAEPDDACEGKGVYLLRDEEDVAPVALMAPHRGADRWTGNIAAQLFDEHPFAAAAWNSAPRHASSECDTHGDVTRVPTHFFTSFSLAFASRFPQGRVVQLHGFDRKLRTSAAGRRADIIVSDGTESPSDGLLSLADCLGNALPLHVISAFPVDTPELGALHNRQGQALRNAGFDGFVHVEIASELRRSLTEDAQLRASLAQCLRTGVQ
jgi:hypothetical protein